MLQNRWTIASFPGPQHDKMEYRHKQKQTNRKQNDKRSVAKSRTLHRWLLLSPGNKQRNSVLTYGKANKSGTERQTLCRKIQTAPPKASAFCHVAKSNPCHQKLVLFAGNQTNESNLALTYGKQTNRKQNGKRYVVKKADGAFNGWCLIFSSFQLSFSAWGHSPICAELRRLGPCAAWDLHLIAWCLIRWKLPE